jgi:hypothetical protein
LNDLEVDNPSALNIDDAENLPRSASSMVSAAADPDDSWLLHLLAIFGADFTGEPNDSRDDQDLGRVSYRRGERDQPDIQKQISSG